jgi:putative ABC transport system ATP-binding protein
MRILTGLWQDGKTVILITHDGELAARARRTIHIHDGRIVRDENLGGFAPEPPQ